MGGRLGQYGRSVPEFLGLAVVTIEPAKPALACIVGLTVLDSTACAGPHAVTVMVPFVPPPQELRSQFVKISCSGVQFVLDGGDAWRIGAAAAST